MWLGPVCDSWLYTGSLLNFFKEYSNNKGLFTVDSPLYMSDEEKKEPEMAPEIGANTYSILTELGYNNEDIKVLEERKIIKT